MEITVVMYIYPGVEKYLGDLIKSINRQSIKTFNVIIFNDNLKNAKHLFKNLNTDFQIIGVEGTVNEIRFNSLSDIKKKGSDYIIFQDADDFMAQNRIEECSKALDNYDIVVNDLSIIDTNSKILESSYWEKRLEEGFTFDSCYLRNKNIVGLGNTAIKKYLLADVRLCFSLMPLAFDWFLFYQIFKLNNLKAVFIKNTTTFYRQHQENIAGVKELDSSRLKHILNVKKLHYESLSKIGYDFERELNELSQINPEEVDFLKFNLDDGNTNLFWWEETKNLIKNYENYKIR